MQISCPAAGLRCGKEREGDSLGLGSKPFCLATTARTRERGRCRSCELRIKCTSILHGEQDDSELTVQFGSSEFLHREQMLACLNTCYRHFLFSRSNQGYYLLTMRTRIPSLKELLESYYLAGPWAQRTWLDSKWNPVWLGTPWKIRASATWDFRNRSCATPLSSFLSLRGLRW